MKNVINIDGVVLTFDELCCAYYISRGLFKLSQEEIIKQLKMDKYPDPHNIDIEKITNFIDKLRWFYSKTIRNKDRKSSYNAGNHMGENLDM